MKSPFSSLFIYYIKGTLIREPSSPSFIGTWEEEGDSFLFFSAKEDEEVLKLLEESGLTLTDFFEVDYLEWIGGRFKEIEIGDIRIIPIWEGEKGRKGDILLDPSVVFGAGTHPTTFSCLEGLNLLFSQENIESVVDMGCGTGILSLFCAKKGARKVLALDLNPLAVKTTRNNILLNDFGDRVLALRARAQDFVSLPVDLIIANIHFEILRELLDQNDFFTKRFFVLSGFFPSQMMEIREILSQHGARISGIIGMHTGWPTIVGGFTNNG